MKDPQRIDDFCDRLKAVWHKLPDLRFSQLLSIVYSTLPFTPFYIEDDGMIKAIENWAKAKSTNNERSNI